MPFFDANLVKVDNAAVTGEPGDSIEWSVVIEPTVNSVLSTPANSQIAMSARLDPGDSWTNLETTPLDLSSFANSQVEVLLKVDIEALAVVGQSVFDLELTE